MDAPFHFNEDGKTVDLLSIGELIGPLRVIDISDKIFCDGQPDNADYCLQVSDITAHESTYGTIQQGDMVLVRTLWSRYYSLGSKAYLGFDSKIDGKYDPMTSKLSFPAIGPEAARLLVERGIKAIGLDTASMDPGYSTDFPVHRIILGAGIFGIENINENIKHLPNSGSNLIVLPLKIVGGSGAPSRVIATIQKQ